MAILPMHTPALQVPPHASVPPQVGDRWYSVYTTAEGRALAECSVAGRGTGAEGDARWLLDFYPVAPPRGAPVLTQNGELLAVVSGTRDPAFWAGMEVSAWNTGMGSVPAVPIALVLDSPGRSPVAITELRARREVLPPALGALHLAGGGFALRLSSERPVDEREEFTAADKKLVVYVRWNPNQRLRGVTRLFVWGPDGRLAMESKPKKADLKADTLVLSHWELPVPAPHGRYVVEVLLDDRVMWRSAFQVR